MEKDITQLKVDMKEVKTEIDNMKKKDDTVIGVLNDINTNIREIRDITVESKTKVMIMEKPVEETVKRSLKNETNIKHLIKGFWIAVATTISSIGGVIVYIIKK